MASFAFASVARSDDANKHGEEDFGFEGEEVGELFEEEKDNAG
jgi:hypothetical protein